MALRLGRVLWRFRRWLYAAYMLVAALRIPWRTRLHLVAPSCDTRLTLANVALSLTKVPHLLLFGLFFLLTVAQFDRIDRKTLGASVLLTGALGLLVELEEGATRTGNCRLTDVLPDLVSAVVGMALLLALVSVATRMGRMAESEPSSLGLAPGTVRIAPYDPAWPGLFVAEAARLLPILAAHDVTLRLEHTGSTAVPGLAAKPILDILAGYDDVSERATAIAALTAAGYTYRGEQGICGRDFFRRGEPRQYHVHLTRVGSAFWHDHLTFRDHLRATPGTAEAYAALKLELAARHPTARELYIEGKTEFVHAALARARGNTPEESP